MSRIETQGMPVELLSTLMTAKADQSTPPDDGFRTLLEGALQNDGALPVADSTQAVQTDRPQADAPKAKDDAAPSDKAPDEQTNEVEAAPDAQALATAVAAAIHPEIMVTPEIADEAASNSAIPVLTAELSVDQQILQEATLETAMELPAQAADLPQETVQTEQSDAVQETAPLSEMAKELELPIVSAETESEAAVEPEQPVAVHPLLKLPDDFELQEKFDRMIEDATQELTGVAQAREEASAETAEPVATSTAKPEVTVARSEATRLREADRDETMDPAQVQAVSAKPQTERAEFQPLETTQQNTAVSQADQIQARVIENLEQQKMEFRMQLQPEELGRIDVRMVLESGRLAVQIIASSARTAELLQRQMDGLAASLRIGSIDLTSVQVVTQAEAEGGFMQQALDMSQSHAQEETGEQNGEGRKKQNADPFASNEEILTQRAPQSILDRAV